MTEVGSFSNGTQHRRELQNSERSHLEFWAGTLRRALRSPRSSDLRGTSPHGSVPSGSLFSIPIDKRSLRQIPYSSVLTHFSLSATFFRLLSRADYVGRMVFTCTGEGRDRAITSLVAALFKSPLPCPATQPNWCCA